MNITPQNLFTSINIKNSLSLPADKHFPDAGHCWHQREIDALILATAARRPLLVRGEAGSGKSQIARAAARVLGNQSPMVEVIHPRFEARDLLWQFDAIERLANANKSELDTTNQAYVKKGLLWQAIEISRKSSVRPVLLIDEIDKADTDLPNALLDVLGNRSFDVPPMSLTVNCNDHPPLIIITTNEERELPAAFVRRCIVLNLNPPADETSFIQWLIDRGMVHSHLSIAEKARQLAAQQVFVDRNNSIANGYARVGLAEYIDLLNALHDLTHHLAEQEREEQQIEWLKRLNVYALVKAADQPQDREPINELKNNHDAEK